jgi:hypothetical protein
MTDRIIKQLNLPDFYGMPVQRWDKLRSTLPDAYPQLQQFGASVSSWERFLAHSPIERAAQRRLSSLAVRTHITPYDMAIYPDQFLLNRGMTQEKIELFNECAMVYCKLALKDRFLALLPSALRRK